ncbi:MAG: PD40 domain-containing protein [Anaerolineae bacterium]|nr:PD40 domain-containing protein [Gemmatimonadaceae bacterium]
MLAVAAMVSTAKCATAQDTTRKGVRIGLTYQPGTKPVVVVLPISGVAGDSIAGILSRDLDFSDRVEVVTPTSAVAFDAARGNGGRAPNYGLWKTLGGAAVVEGSVTAAGVLINVHDVGQARIAEAREFPLPSTPLSGDWRMALHGLSDEVLRWISGTRGSAQSRVAYVRDKQIHIVDSDGAEDRVVTQGSTALSPAWHPKAQYIAYSKFGERGTEIHIADLSNGSTRRLTAAGGLNITPEWSPDGQWIVYAHGAEDGTDLVMAGALDTGPVRKITVGKGTDNTSPSFSPDGRRLAFTSGRSGHPEIYVMDTDGANAELLTPFQFGETSYRSGPSWSPDGRRVAFQSRIDGRFQIVTINLRDRGMKQLTNEGSNEDPSWSPDGRHIVIASNRSGSKQLWVLDAESGRARQLTRSGGARLAAWSPIISGAR